MLPQSDTEAYLWALKSAEMGLAKAEYAVGYFTEVSFSPPSPLLLLYLSHSITPLNPIPIVKRK